MSSVPQRMLVPTIFECSNGSAMLSEQISQRSGTQRSVLPIKRECTTESDQVQRSENSLIYTISNHKASQFEQTEQHESQHSQQQPLRELQNRINQCVISDEHEHVKSHPQQTPSGRFIYPTFNPSYSSLNLGHRRSSLDMEQETKDIQHKIRDYRAKLKTVTQGNDQEKCAMVKDYFQERSSQQGNFQKKTQEVKSNSSFVLNDRSSLLCDITYDQDSSRNDQSFNLRKRRAKSLHRKTCGNSVDEPKQNEVVDNLSYLLGVEGEEEIYKQACHLKRENVRHQKFLNSLQDMIVKLTPPGAYEDHTPNLKECWRWIKRILRDHMILKKEAKPKQDILDFLVYKLELQDEEEIPGEVDKIIQMLYQSKFHQRM